MHAMMAILAVKTAVFPMPTLPQVAMVPPLEVERTTGALLLLRAVTAPYSP